MSQQDPHGLPDTLHQPDGHGGDMSDSWAQALLKRFVTNRQGASPSTSAGTSQVDACTQDLGALLRRIQISSAADRPSVAQNLRSDVVNSLDRLASSCDGHVVCQAGQNDHAHAIVNPATRSQSMRISVSQLSCPDDVHESSFAESCVDYNERCMSWPEPSGSCTVAGEELRMQEFFPTDATFVNAKVKELFFQREEDANNKVLEFMEESDTFLPPIVRFNGIDTVVSISRLAAFTGVRFFRSCAIQCLVTPAGTGHHITPRTIQSVDVQECDPASLALLLQLIEGRAPKKATLQQACDIFSVLEYCLADSLLEIIPNYLEPLMEELSARELVLLLVSALRHSHSSDANRTARDTADSGDTSASAPQSPYEEPQPPVFARLLQAAAASPALCRRSENSELHGLAFQTLACCAALTSEHAGTLLQLCASPSLPAWLRAGCLAAACHCASGPGLSRAIVDQAICATNHVIYSCAHSTEATATLRSFLAAAASASASAAHADLWSMVLLQAATEERALQYASVARIAHPILSDSPADPFPAIQIPLSRPGRHLVVARMPVSRRSKDLTYILKFFSTNKKPETPMERRGEVTDAPVVGAFMCNQDSSARLLRFVLGIFPVPCDPAWESRAVSVICHLQRVFAHDSLAASATTAVNGACLPVFAKARETEFAPRRGLGFKSFPGDKERYEAWLKHGQLARDKVFVFACFENGASAASNGAGVAAASDSPKD